MNSRYHGLDILRGLAVFLMLLFHFTYDLWLFNHVSDEFFRTPFWWGLPRFIVFVFFWCVGASLELVHGKGIRWPSFWRRWLKLLLLALIISGATYFTFPKSWIFMGTIHCIALVSILALPFLRWPMLRWPFLIIILIGQYLLSYDIAWVATFFPQQTMDFIPPYPWFWVVLLGLISGTWVLERWHARPHPFFEFLGRHALPIYLIHQALFYALFSLVAWTSGPQA
jgi:uncharacterized membrane protein